MIKCVERSLQKKCFLKDVFRKWNKDINLEPSDFVDIIERLTTLDIDHINSIL